MSKVMMLAAGATGYVLGARAGRERYEQIKSTANKVAQDPRVRAKAQDASTKVKEKAPLLKDKVADTSASMKSKSGSDSDPAPVMVVDPPVTGVDPSTTPPYPAS